MQPRRTHQAQQKADSDHLDGLGEDDNLTYEPYPKGFYIGASVSVFYRNMRADSAWRFNYNGSKTYDNPLWGPAAALELGYQASQRWGVAAQGGWVGEQRVTSGAAGSGFSKGDSKRLRTCWAALLLRMRLKMDYRYYFIAEFGPTWVSQGLRSQTGATQTNTRTNGILPTGIIGIQYRATENLNVGVQYQLIWGQRNWRDTWAGSVTRYPALQMLGVKLSYQFNT